jgi:serine/threonine protein phosphatase PrpC
MQDSHKATTDLAKSNSEVPADEHYAFFAVYDGHGGRECADFLEARLHGASQSSAPLLALIQEGRNYKNRERENRETDTERAGVYAHRDGRNRRKKKQRRCRSTEGTCSRNCG